MPIITDPKNVFRAAIENETVSYKEARTLVKAAVDEIRNDTDPDKAFQKNMKRVEAAAVFLGSDTRAKDVLDEFASAGQNALSLRLRELRGDDPAPVVSAGFPDPTFAKLPVGVTAADMRDFLTTVSRMSAGSIAAGSLPDLFAAEVVEAAKHWATEIQDQGWQDAWYSATGGVDLPSQHVSLVMGMARDIQARGADWESSPLEGRYYNLRNDDTVLFAPWTDTGSGGMADLTIFSPVPTRRQIVGDAIGGLYQGNHYNSAFYDAGMTGTQLRAVKSAISEELGGDDAALPGVELSHLARLLDDRGELLGHELEFSLDGNVWGKVFVTVAGKATAGSGS